MVDIDLLRLSYHIRNTKTNLLDDGVGRYPRMSWFTGWSLISNNVAIRFGARFTPIAREIRSHAAMLMRSESYSAFIFLSRCLTHTKVLQYYRPIVYLLPFCCDCLVAIRFFDREIHNEDKGEKT